MTFEGNITRFYLVNDFNNLKFTTLERQMISVSEWKCIKGLLIATRTLQLFSRVVKKESCKKIEFCEHSMSQIECFRSIRNPNDCICSFFKRNNL